MISVRMKAEIWWGKHENLVSLTKQVIVSQNVKLIREEEHQEYLLNTGCNLLSSENTKNNENTKQVSDPQARKENKKDIAETNREFHWPSGNCAIVVDSMVNGIDEKLKCFTFWVKESIMI